MIFGAVIAAGATLALGIVMVAFAEGMPPLIETLLTPFIVVLLWPGAMVTWSLILGDTGTVQSLWAVATAISLLFNTAAGAWIGRIAAHWVAPRKRN